MSQQYQTKVLRSGTRLQSGIPKRSPSVNPGSAAGVLLRGVVTATYVVDDPQHPFSGNDTTVPTAVYCDVLTFGRRWYFIPKCLVAQERSGLHSGHVWKPRACTMNITGDPVDLNKGTNPAVLDGDHVLVGFLDNNFNQPIILRALPHPAADVGNEGYGVGHRLKLRVEDGDPDFYKHNGSYYGIHANGDFYIDTTHANDGALNNDGSEPDPPTDSKGSVVCKLPKDARWSVKLMDMSDPLDPKPVLIKELTKDGNIDHYGENFVWEVNISDFSDPENPDPIATIRLAKDKFEIEIDDASGLVQALIGGGTSFLFQGKDSGASLTVGDGAKSAIIAEAWELFFDGVFKTWMITHNHPTGVGPSGPPIQSGAFPAYAASAATSTKLTFPDL